MILFSAQAWYRQPSVSYVWVYNLSSGEDRTPYWTLHIILTQKLQTEWSVCYSKGTRDPPCPLDQYSMCEEENGIDHQVCPTSECTIILREKTEHHTEHLTSFFSWFITLIISNIDIMTMHSPVSISTVRSLHEHVDCRHEHRSQSIHWLQVLIKWNIICEREMIMKAVRSFDGAS